MFVKNWTEIEFYHSPTIRDQISSINLENHMAMRNDSDFCSSEKSQDCH